MTDAEVTSIRSPRVKAARQLAKRALRERARSFLAEGPQAVGEALASDGVVSQLFVTAAGRARHGELAERAAGLGIEVHPVSGEVMAELAQTITPQGVLAVCRFVDVPLACLAGAAPRLTVILANVRDPGNAGTVLRTADAAGADGVVFAGTTVDPYNSKCVRATAGSLFHLPLVAGVPVAAAVAARRAASWCWLRTAGRPVTWTRPTRPGCWPSRPPGCSATRRGDCRPTWPGWPTRRSQCRCTGRRKALTWRRQQRSACTALPAGCGNADGGRVPLPWPTR